MLFAVNDGTSEKKEVKRGKLPQQGNSNRYPQHMFLGVLNTVFFHTSNFLPHLEIMNRSIQIVIITNFVIISNVGIKRFECNNK